MLQIALRKEAHTAKWTAIRAHLVTAAPIEAQQSGELAPPSGVLSLLYLDDGLGGLDPQRRLVPHQLVHRAAQVARRVSCTPTERPPISHRHSARHRQILTNPYTSLRHSPTYREVQNRYRPANVCVVSSHNNVGWTQEIGRQQHSITATSI